MKDGQGTPLLSVRECHMEGKVTPKPGGLSSEGLILLSASVSPSGREAPIPAESRPEAEGPSAEETLSSADPAHPGCLAATEGVTRPLCSQDGHDVVLCHMHTGLRSPSQNTLLSMYTRPTRGPPAYQV